MIQVILHLFTAGGVDFNPTGVNPTRINTQVKISPHVTHVNNSSQSSLANSFKAVQLLAPEHPQAAPGQAQLGTLWIDLVR